MLGWQNHSNIFYYKKIEQYRVPRYNLSDQTKSQGGTHMLFTNYTESLVGIKDVILLNVQETLNTKIIELKIKQHTWSCPVCNSLTSKIHDYRTQNVKDIPMFGMKTILRIHKRRYVCKECGKKFYEKIEVLPKYQRTTNRLWGYVLSELSLEYSMKSIAKRVNLSSTSIARILDVLSFSPKTLPEAISIDEFRGNTDGNKFQCIITNPKTHEVIDILPKKKAEDLYEYFSKFDNRRDVKYVVMDMSIFFKNVMKACFPNAIIIADKYHVQRQVSWALENVRKRVQEEFHEDRRKYFKRSRTLLLKDFNKLKEDEFEQLSHMLELSKDLAKSYYLMQEFYKVMDSQNYYEAKHRLSDWFMHYQVANIREFDAAFRAYTNWQVEILNAFDTGLSNGYTEGCNNRIKVIKRNAYGMRNFERFRKRIMHVMTA